jgi:hypothetical protein
LSRLLFELKKLHDELWHWYHNGVKPQMRRRTSSTTGKDIEKRTLRLLRSMPSKDLLPGLHQMIATAFLKNHMPLGRYQMAEHFQTGVNLTKARVGFMFLPSSAKDFVPDGVVLRTPGFSIGPLDTFALWSRGNVRLFTASSAFSGKSGRSCENRFIDRQLGGEKPTIR